MRPSSRRQSPESRLRGPGDLGDPFRPPRMERIIPNPKLKLLDQVREVMRLKPYSIRTQRCYCDWIGRYVHFHGLKSRADLEGARPQAVTPARFKNVSEN